MGATEHTWRASVSDAGVKRLLLGIELTLFGVLLAQTSSGLGAVVFVIGVVGLAVALSGLLPERT